MLHILNVLHISYILPVLDIDDGHQVTQNPDHRRLVAHCNSPRQFAHRLHSPGKKYLQSLKRNLISAQLPYIDFQYLSLVGVMASSAVCILLSLVYTIFLMRGKHLEKKISLRDVLNLTTFKDGLGLVFRKRERGQRMVIITIIIICILCQFSWGTRSSVLFLVQKNIFSAGSWESITTTYVHLILGPSSLMTRLTRSNGQASSTPSATFPRCSICLTL